MSDDWLPGQVARITLVATDAGGQAVDPSMLRLKVVTPDETVTTYQFGIGPIVRSAAGQYHADIALASAGVWSWRWESDASHVGATEGSLLVQPSAIPVIP